MVDSTMNTTEALRRRRQFWEGALLAGLRTTVSNAQKTLLLADIAAAAAAADCFHLVNLLV